MGDQMNRVPTEDELDLTAEEFKKTFKAFQKAAKKFISVLENMNKKTYQELKALFGDNQKIYDFLIQIMDDSGQLGEKCFGIRFMAEKEKKKE
jgi:hypothetical protein